jgi:ribosomal protein S18 acetylase RimI-like enzyme
MFQVTARFATHADIETLDRLYVGLQAEMEPLSHLWPLADGLAEPVSESFADAVTDPDSVVLVGEIDSVPVGFLMARVERRLPQADGRRIGAIRLVYVDHPAREVGVGEAMLTEVLAEFARRGISTFDAHVLPGHRLVKNFFESGGFKARSIHMSRYTDV